jgi:hypothetical protein
VVPLDDGRPLAISPLDRVRESILDTRVDLELPDPARRKLALDGGNERPHQALPPARRIDEHVEKGRAALGPRWSRHGESDQRRAVPRRHHHGIPVGHLPSHLALGEGARAPLLTFELQHPRPQLAPGCGIERDGPDRRRH